MDSVSNSQITTLSAVEEEGISWFDSEAEQLKWETYTFHKHSILYLFRKDGIAEELNHSQCGVCVALYTTESWNMMRESRAKKRDNGVVYGTVLPRLPFSKKIKTIYTLDRNIETGRILGIGSISDPHNLLNPANTNGRSVALFKPPYHFLNAYVYGGPKWVTRSHINRRFLPYIYMLEQLVWENPWVRISRHQTKEEYMYKKRGLFQVPVSYFVQFEERQMASSMYPVGIHELCCIILNEPPVVVE